MLHRLSEVLVELSVPGEICRRDFSSPVQPIWKPLIARSAGLGCSLHWRAFGCQLGETMGKRPTLQLPTPASLARSDLTGHCGAQLCKAEASSQALLIPTRAPGCCVALGNVFNLSTPACLFAFLSIIIPRAVMDEAEEMELGLGRDSEPGLGRDSRDSQ